MTISLNVSSAHGNLPCPSNPSSGTGWFRQALARPPRWTGGVVWGSLLTAAAVHAETLTVLNTEAGTTPARLGYNLGHFMPGSNAADWFRYSGVDAARVFISVSDIEPLDDLAPVGDGVTTEASFFSRRALLRANGASRAAVLNADYVNWAAFAARYDATATGNNRLKISYSLGVLRDRGIAILANITASPSRFPVGRRRLGGEMGVVAALLRPGFFVKPRLWGSEFLNVQ